MRKTEKTELAKKATSQSSGRTSAENAAVQAYEQALAAMQSQKFERAKPLFEKVIASGPTEFADRAMVHLNTCRQQLTHIQNKFSTSEEHYDYAVSLINSGDYVGAREHLEAISKEDPNLDYAWYGLSILECLTGRIHESLQHLAESIRLNPGNRLQARNDSDFRNMADDPRFTELIYPEGPA